MFFFCNKFFPIFGLQNLRSGSGSARIDKKCWIRIHIRIRIETMKPMRIRNTAFLYEELQRQKDRNSLPRRRQEFNGILKFLLLLILKTLQVRLFLSSRGFGTRRWQRLFLFSRRFCTRRGQRQLHFYHQGLVVSGTGTNVMDLN